MTLVNHIVQKSFPTFCFDSISLLKDYVSKPHCDEGNLGPSCAFTVGQFTGGALSGEGWSVDVHRKPTLFCSVLPHWGEAFEGSRVNVICYTRLESFNCKYMFKDFARLHELGFRQWPSLGIAATWATAHQCAVKLPRDPILHSVRLAQWKDEVLQVLLYALADFQSREQALLGVSRVANSVMGTEAKRKAVSSFLAVVQGNEHWFADATKL